MSGPIVRSGPSKAYWENWEKAFGGKKTKTKRGAGKTVKKKTAKKKKD